MLLAWRNHPNVHRFMFSQHEIGLDESHNWFTKTSKDPSRRLLIAEENKRPIGFVQFSQVTEGGISNWGFYTNPDVAKGAGRKLGVIALSYAFGDLKLHKVCGQALAGNKASIALHKRLGFTLESILRDQKSIKDIHHTLYCFGLLGSEWNPKKLIQE